MINILSYVGMNMQSEVCLWTLLGLTRTIFDATLFKVNANLKQVWQMSMPAEISMSVQRVIRTMISGIMLVQCFTVYVYLASYIVLLYPAFLEERPTLVLPWLLLAAIRKLLCELLSLALGLGTCVLVGAARPPCIKFVIIKIVSIMPSVYMWFLVLNYYNTLKVASVFEKFPTTVAKNDPDYGLELAIRRRRTKSLLGEAQLRNRLLSNWYVERPSSADKTILPAPSQNIIKDLQASLSTIYDDVEKIPGPTNTPDDITSSSGVGTGTYEDWLGSEITVPRNTDRITEQFALMLLRISAYLKKTKYVDERMFETHQVILSSANDLNLERYPTLTSHSEDTPPLVGSSRENTASYLRLYPQIFMKGNFDSIKAVRSPIYCKLTETTKTEPPPVVSIDTGNNSVQLEEKATTSIRIGNKLNTDLEANNELKESTTQKQSTTSIPELNVSVKNNNP